LTSSFSLPVYVFGFEAEPDFLGFDEITASFYNGSTLVGTIDQNVNGTGGALLFAAFTTTNPFTSVAVNDVDGDDFAIARQRYSVVSTQFSSTPEPGGLLLLGSGLMVLIFLRKVFLRKRLAPFA
ncbi:MAG: PEP-CTERM sorting domain-containing protein, partial [Bryobacteraceae bacterium]